MLSGFTRSLKSFLLPTVQRYFWSRLGVGFILSVLKFVIGPVVFVILRRLLAMRFMGVFLCNGDAWLSSSQWSSAIRARALFRQVCLRRR